MRYSLAVVASAVALVLELAVHDVGSHHLFIAFAPAVAFSAWYGGLGPGALAVLLSLLATDYFFLGSGRLLDVTNHGDIISFTTFTGCWLAVSLLAESVYRRLQQEGRWRVEAERMAGQADRLERFTAAVGNTHTTAAAVEACVQEVLYALKAESGAVLLVADDGGAAEVVRAVGYDPAFVERWTRVPLNERSAIADVVRARAPLLFESTDALLTEYPSDHDMYDPGRKAVVVLPLVTGGRVAGVLRLDFARQRSFDADDREFLRSIAPRAAQALDRNAQYEAAQRARAEAERERARADEELAERQRVETALRAREAQYRSLAARTARLHVLSAALSEAVTLGAVAAALVHQGKVAVGAAGASVALLTDAGRSFETLYAEDAVHGVVDPGERFDKVDGFCATAVVETREPVFVSSFGEWQKRYSRSASRAADGGYVSSATLPLLVENSAIGVLDFHFTVPVNFDDEYKALLVSVAQLSAQAIDRARLYESAQRARAEAETANRLKDEFLSVVSHELRTPLNSIVGWAAMLAKGQLDQQQEARALHAIQENATRQAKLVDDLLDFSRIVAGRAKLDLQAVDLSSLLSGVVDSVLPMAAARGVELGVDAPAGIRVVGDVRRLEQVFFNILGNAVKFTQKGGKVHVAARSLASEVEVHVVDTGVGIDPTFLPHVFDRFRQGDTTAARNYGGLGLGLSIARQLVEAHKGSISADSGGAGQGSTFIVTLPLASRRADDRLATMAGHQPGDAEDEGTPSLSGVQVLVVDDEADARDVMACALAACGARVMVASRAAEALALLSETHVDVLLADIAMPDIDGYAFIRQVRASEADAIAHIPAAAITAHALDADRREALDAGYQVHIPKPIDPTHLARVVETLARGPGGHT